MADSIVYHLDERNDVFVEGDGRQWRLTAALRFAEEARLFGHPPRYLEQLHVADDGETQWRRVPLVITNG